MNSDEKRKLDHIVNRVAELEAKKKEIAEEIKELCDDAKDKLGRSPKVIKQLAKEKNWDEIERMAQRELEEELDDCRSALGLLADLPLGEHAQRRQEEKRARKGRELEPAGSA